MGRVSSIEIVLDCMGSICPIHNIWETVQKDYFTIDDEGIIIISIRTGFTTAPYLSLYGQTIWGGYV